MEKQVSDGSDLTLRKPSVTCPADAPPSGCRAFPSHCCRPNDRLRHCITHIISSYTSYLSHQYVRSSFVPKLIFY